MSTQWKLVPVEPTETMVSNGFESEPNECFTDEEVWEQYQDMSGCQQAAFRAKLCWAAMLGSAPAPDTITAASKESSGVDFGIDGRSVRVSQEAYGIFLAREASAREKIEALQQRLNEADQRIDELTGAASRAAADVIAERQRQIMAEGHNPERDDCYSFGELALAAAGYAASAGGARSIGRQLFRWDNVHWKPSTPRRDLVKAGALILAEIERIDRAAITNFPL